ncbi:hypothetical protein QMZ05_19410 [Bradyrhizobium sp. INPA03-11B]|uniref:hypothetical protein n=1 Tax=Bradyrhizobium sp. INPA03-11B TaxID=418598 RepID=UPI00338E7A48
MTSISGGTISTTFSYDANGNQIAGFGRSISWTSLQQAGERKARAPSASSTIPPISASSR